MALTPMMKVYDSLKPARGKISYQKDLGEFRGVKKIRSKVCFRAKICKKNTFSMGILQ
jgi:hypothetical protein